MKKMKPFLLLITFTVFLISCGESSQEVTIGQEFSIEDAPITNLKLESSKAIKNEDKTKMTFAPKGKQIIHFGVKNPSNKMIFLNAYSNDQKIEAESNLTFNSHGLDSDFEDKFYFIDENTTINKIEIKTAGGGRYVVNNPTLSESTSVVISESVQKLVNSYTTQKPTAINRSICSLYKRRYKCI